MLVVIAVFLWSTGGLFIKSTTIDAYQVTFFRSLFAAVTVLIVTRKSGLKIDLFGIFTSVIYALLLFLFVWATKKTTARGGESVRAPRLEREGSRRRAPAHASAEKVRSPTSSRTPTRGA